MNEARIYNAAFLDDLSIQVYRRLCTEKGAREEFDGLSREKQLNRGRGYQRTIKAVLEALGYQRGVVEKPDPNEPTFL